MTPVYDTHELAWAAGFFDGEGSTSKRNQKKMIPVLTIGQIDTRVLERFKAAVKFGVIYGPFLKKARPDLRPQYNYQSGNFEQTQQVLASLWGYLSPQKKEQAIRIFTEYRKRLTESPDARMGTGRCKRNHDLTLPDAYIVYKRGSRRCRQCDNQYFKDRRRERA